MVTIEKKLDFPYTYPLERLGKLDELLFFDIETTGFSGLTSNLYLIGCVYYNKAGWQMIQWFADQAGAEEELLHAFFHFLKNFKILIHFNGDGFDIPYLLKRCSAFGLPYNFSEVASVDIYKKIRPYRRLLGLESMKQKAIEQFLGVFRTDKYSGGQLIQVYQDYLMTHEDFLYRLLMLHNEDDLKGMPEILPILSYCDFLQNDFVLENQHLQVRTDIFGGQEDFLILTCESPVFLPVEFNREDELLPGLSLSAAENKLTAEVPLYRGILKHFFSDYKNYYYLPYEDTAVHKSVGEYVDKAARKQATAATCYAKKEGCFLPQFSQLFSPELKTDRKSKISYVEYKDGLFQDSKALNAYIQSLLHRMS